jgi:hypothetical protein
MLAAALAAGILGVSVALGLPLVFVVLSRSVHVLATGVSAALPFIVARVLERRADAALAAPHAGPGRALVFLADGRVWVSREELARWLGELQPSSVSEAERLPQPRARGQWIVRSVMPLAFALVALLVHGWMYPRARVLNLTDRTLVIALDEHVLGRLEPSGMESARAGLELRLPVGKHRLWSRTLDGAVVADSTVVVRAGAQHLYAPAAEEWCFYLERERYGRASQASPIERLTGAAHFWVLHESVDVWFASLPPGHGSPMSGRALTALRQARCAELERLERENASAR